MTRWTGKPRQITDAQIARLRAWNRGCGVTLAQLAAELGLKPRTAVYARRHQHKQPSP